MAVSFRLTAAPLYPEGTLIGAYQLDLFSARPQNGIAPPIAATSTAVVDAHGFATIANLVGATMYVAGAQVNGEWRYVYFDTAPDTSVSVSLTGEAAAQLTKEKEEREQADGTERIRAEGVEAALLSKALNLSDLPNKATARTNLGLGTIATHAEADYAPITSPKLLGVPEAPTAAEAVETAQLATTRFVHLVATAAKVAAEASSDKAGAAKSEETRAKAAEALLQPLAQKNQASGYAGLNAEGKVDPEHLPFEELETGEAGYFLEQADAEGKRVRFVNLLKVVEERITTRALLRGGWHNITATGSLAANTYNEVTGAGGYTLTPSLTPAPADNDFMVILNNTTSVVTVVLFSNYVLSPGRILTLMGGNGGWQHMGETVLPHNGAAVLGNANGGGPVAYGGSGAPNKPQGALVLKVGDLYFRTDPEAGKKQTLYRCTKTTGTEAENWAEVV